MNVYIVIHHKGAYLKPEILGVRRTLASARRLAIRKHMGFGEFWEIARHKVRS
jgi:hypothetical protein